MDVLFDALQTRARSQPSAPFVTWYGPEGERAELSGVTFANAVAKTAGALVDEWDVEPGTHIRLDLPLHWQLPVWLAACDVAGLVVVFDDTPAQVVVTDQLEADPASGVRRVVTPTTAFGLPGGPVPDGALDHARDAMGQPDQFLGVPCGGQWHVSGVRWPAAQIIAAAEDLAARWGVGPQDRLLVTGAVDPMRRALTVWPLPLLSGAATVLSAGGDGSDVVDVEHITHRVDDPAEP